MKKMWEKWTGVSLVKRIIVGLAIGVILALAVPPGFRDRDSGRCICGRAQSDCTASGIFPCYELFVKRGEVTWRRDSDRHYSVYVQHRACCCHCGICKHDFPGGYGTSRGSGYGGFSTAGDC